MCGRRRYGHEDLGAPRRLSDTDVRASDAEREDVVALLRTHAGEGRLDLEELDQRVEAAYAAKTHRDLRALTIDLPRAPRAPRDERREFRDHLRQYLSIMALLVVIWALTGMGYFWPIWPIMGWGIAVAMHASALRRPPQRRRLAA